ncbi:hypothetical protein MIS46_04010 [Wielerella bovis]|uniref:hypothetical protein n=1 Tax=Wielerella bovis TaxID=2917790 RepID=UPI0020195D4B|nr:hypothetical protein [Wielerella bovis]ULJ63221.1 hypothetical protein MIS46_04010 [Wielerella bovis]
MKKNGFIWWEKHVEYKYIRDNINLSAMPLDGDFHEQAGDNIFTQDKFFRIIEFKSHQDDKTIKAEIQKYHFYEDGKRYKCNKEKFKELHFEAFKNHSFRHCHFVVYGDVFLKDEKPEFKLCNRQYIEFLYPDEFKSEEQVEYSQIPYDSFIEYLAFIISKKSGTETTTDSCSGQFANVLVIDNEGNVIPFSDVISSPIIQQSLQSQGVTIKNDEAMDIEVPELKNTPTNAHKNRFKK